MGTQPTYSNHWIVKADQRHDYFFEDQRAPLPSVIALEDGNLLEVVGSGPTCRMWKVPPELGGFVVILDLGGTHIPVVALGLEGMLYARKRFLEFISETLALDIQELTSVALQNQVAEEAVEHEEDE